MRKLVFILFCMILIGSLFVTNTKPPEASTMLNLEEFRVKDEVRVSELKDSTIVTPSGDTTTVYELLKRMGEDFYHLRTPIRKSSCADCHSLKLGGTGLYNKSPGGGEHIGIYKKLYKNWSGKDSYLEEDRKPIKNFSTLNSYRLQDAGVILHTSEVSDFPLELQIGKAMAAHMVSDIVLECQQDPMYNQISYTISGRPLDDKIVKQSISAFEQSLTTSENRINKYLRGEVTTIKYPEGLELYMSKNCNSCHMTSKKAPSRALNPLQDSVKATCLDCNINDHKGYFHTAESITLNKAIKRCDSFLDSEPLTRKEVSKVAAFIRNNLTDNRYKR